MKGDYFLTVYLAAALVSTKRTSYRVEVDHVSVSLIQQTIARDQEPWTVTRLVRYLNRRYSYPGDKQTRHFGTRKGAERWIAARLEEAKNG